MTVHSSSGIPVNPAGALDSSPQFGAPAGGPTGSRIDAPKVETAPPTSELDETLKLESALSDAVSKQPLEPVLAGQSEQKSELDSSHPDFKSAMIHSFEVVEHKIEETLKNGRHSVFNVAFAIFVVTNLLLSFSPPIEFDKFNFPYKGWAWWTFNDLRKSGDEHNVALLGSSLMVSAVNNADAMYLQKPLNLANYHNAVFLDKLLVNKFGGQFKTYNLAAPGQMPSDAYMSLHAMLKTHQRPDVVVYGVAPRDFYDSSMASPVDTEPYKFLHRLVNLDDSWNKLFKSPFDKLNFILERDCFLYGNALDISMIVCEKWDQTLNKFFPAPTGKNMFTYWDRVKLLPAYKAGEIHPLAVVCHPQKPGEPAEFVDNTPEYKERYRDPDIKNYKIQHYFLLKLVELCKRERIELVVVNMPITLDNIRVLGSYRYMGYVNALRQMSKDHKVPAFDLNDFALYSKSDYHDGVHLNAYGAKKLFKQLTGIMGGTFSTSLALEASGNHLARRKALADQRLPDNFKTDIPL